MSLRIGNHGQFLNLASAPKTSLSQPDTAAAQQATSIQSPVQDAASISSLGSGLSGVFTVRQDKVDALRAQVESGTYKVDANAIAAAMISHQLM